MTVRPDSLTDRPNPTRGPDAADPLSEVLRSVRLVGGVFLDTRFTAPFCVTAKITAEDCAPFLRTPAQLIAYHYVIDGQLLLGLEAEDLVEVKAGEIVLLPYNDAHTLASAPGHAPVNARSLIEPADGGGMARISFGGGGEPTHIVCGFLGTEERHNPLIATLPRLLKLDVNDVISRDWVEASLKFAARELAEGRFGPSSVMSRLSELLFAEAVRSHASKLRDGDTGWLRGLGDTQVGRALALIHGNIRTRWTVEALASSVALSRTTFVDRFTSLVGMPPIRYSTHWRLQAAKLQLREGRGTIAQVAHSVGYESEVAFNRAFRREFGSPPAKCREDQRRG
jgi:AraC-like DNA-binding protein